MVVLSLMMIDEQRMFHPQQCHAKFEFEDGPIKLSKVEVEVAKISMILITNLGLYCNHAT